MNTILKSTMLLAVSAMAFSACNKEVDIQEPDKTVDLKQIQFSAVVNDAETRATLTTSDDATFSAAWESGDMADVMEVVALSAASNYNEGAMACWNGSFFDLYLTAIEDEQPGDWAYEGSYPGSEKIPFGSNRVQNGSNYNSAYDVMKGEISFDSALLGQNDKGGHLVIPMERLTSMIYFHLTSDLNEVLSSATLTVEGGNIAAETVKISEGSIIPEDGSAEYNTITITFGDNAPNAQDFRLWFNTLPVNATSLSLTVTTVSNKTVTLSNPSGADYVAGKLYKIVKNGLNWNTSTTAQEYSIVFINKTNKNATELTTTVAASTVIEPNSLPYVIEKPFTAVTKAYYGGNETVGLPLRVGTSSAAGSVTIALSEVGKVSASSIIVNAKQYSNGKTKTIGINSSEKQQPGDDYVDLTFAGGDIEEITLETDGYIYVKYIKVIYTPKQPVNLSFPESVYSITQGETFTAPSLTTDPAGLSVTYSSSNENVAKVNSSTGAISLEGGIGSTTITARFAGDDTYNSGSASYILTVNRAAATSIAQIKSDLANGSNEFSATLTNAIVTRKYSDYIAYIQDETAGILVTDAEELTQGDSYSGTITGEMTTYKNQPEITSIDLSQATKTANATIPAPVEVSIATLISNMSSYDGKLCKIVKAKANSTLASGNNKSVTIAQGENKMTLFTRASFEASTVVKDGYYDIIGLPCLYDDTKEIVVLSTDDVTTSTITWQLSEIAVKTPPTKTSYVIDEYFDPAGLVLSTMMTDVTDNTISKAGEDVAYTSENANDFGFNPDLTTPLTTSVTSVSISYGGKSTSQEITVSTGGSTTRTSTLTFTAKCNGSGTADDDTSWTVTSDGTESNYEEDRGIHYGTSSAKVQYIRLTTSGISGTISKVVVNASTASGVSATASVTVGGSAFGGDPQSLSATATNYTFNGSASGEIVVTVTKPSKAAKALYVKSIAVTYTTTD